MVYGVYCNVFLEHGGLPSIFPRTWWTTLYFSLNMVDYPLFFSLMSTLTGNHCDTLWYLMLLSEPYNPTLTF